MPMEERRAPIVVGARQMSSATTFVTDIAEPNPASFLAKSVNGISVPHTTRNMIVSVTRSICSAISFGVFFLADPSTIAIILSRKVSPASAVTRTTSQSDTSVVPPVTALRSPPDSRITGADSPVIALSSTDAAPSITSPSIGICSPALTYMMSPLLSAAERTSSKSSTFAWFFSLRASTSFRAFLSESAWARPRPSAIASAKLAKSTVNHNMSAIESVYPNPASRIPAKASAQIAVTSTAPIYTTNMTGLRICVAGESFANDWSTASANIDP